MAWNLENLTDQSGRTIVITGGNSGIGYEAALALVGKGARVIIACRDVSKAELACDAIEAAGGSGTIESVALDLASLASVAQCSEELQARCDQLDVLVNNAGVMAIPRRETVDGFEMQLGTNHFGHFALSAHLFPLLNAAENARLVNVSSLAHQFGFINFVNLQGKMFYDPWAAYGQSKLANLLFTYELDRRCRSAGLDILAVACHPGISATNLASAGPRMTGSPLGETLIQFYTNIIAQSAAAGALPTLYAGFGDDIEGGDYTGPDGLGEMRGDARKVNSSFMSRSAGVARQLWQATEEATGIEFHVG